LINENLKHDLSEPHSAKTIHLVIRTLYKKRLFSPNPRNVIIERLNRRPVYPCGKSYGSDGLDMRQLEWGIKEEGFWFQGPVHSLKIILDRSPIKGCLELQENEMTFATYLNELNFKYFKAVIQRAVEALRQSGMRIRFEQTCNSYNGMLIISADRSLSEQNVSQFLERIFNILQTVLRSYSSSIKG